MDAGISQFKEMNGPKQALARRSRLSRKIIQFIISFFLGLTFSVCILFAQPCPANGQFLNIDGIWKKTEDFLQPGKNYSPEMKPEVFRREDEIRQIIYNAYQQPKGMQVNWYHEIYGQPHFKSGPLRYQLSFYLMELYCDPSTHTVKPSDETSNIMNVYVNHFDQFMDYDTFLRIGRMPIWFLPQRVGKLNGMDLFQFSSVRINQRAILITRDGQSPFIPVSRKDYLIALKDWLEKEESKLLEGSLRVARDDKQRENARQYWERTYGPKLKAISDYLFQHAQQELELPALVKELLNFTRFYPEKEGGRMAVLLNLAYFIRTQKLYFPQFMVILWKWNDGEGPGGGLLKPKPPDMDLCCQVSKYYKECIEKNLDAKGLQQLLDK